jgi:hypothetical protein
LSFLLSAKSQNISITTTSHTIPTCITEDREDKEVGKEEERRKTKEEIMWWKILLQLHLL